MAAENEHPLELALSLARLPDSLDGWQVLTVGVEEHGRDYLASLGAGEFVVQPSPSAEPDLAREGFDLVICGSDLDAGVHPLALYAWLRRRLKPSGILVAGSEVLTDPTRSQYARFVPGQEADGKSRWIPGRLAFRWMVEVSGFDAVSWLETKDGEEDLDVSPVYLQAEAADRAPALDLDRQPLSG